MDPLDVATHLLVASPGEFYCMTCLGEAAGVSHLVAQGIGATLAREPGFRRVPERCKGCDLVTMVIAYVPTIKCARCSRQIRTGEPDVVVDENRFHRQCWQILVSNAKIADARQATRLSQELIRRSLSLLGLPPID